MLAPTVRNFLKLLLEAKDSKFFVVYKKSEWISETCPVCKGKGSFKHKGYTYNCKSCYGSGKIPKRTQYSYYQSARIEVDLTKFDLNNMEIKFPHITGEIYGFCKTWDEAAKLCRKLEKEKSTELLEEER